MIRRPPRSTRTDTLFPYTSLFRSESRAERSLLVDAMQAKITEIMKDANLEAIAQQAYDAISGEGADYAEAIAIASSDEEGVGDYDSHDATKIYDAAETTIINDRSEERRVGTGCYSAGRHEVEP